ncbi:MAG TPA: LUD domain-containing protein [Planctomycetota bacterium]|nr:LUD domain-containing protein [Planctomycetota bacterium]
MNRQRYTDLYAKIETALAEKPKRDALYSAMKRSRDNRTRAVKTELKTGLQFRDEVRAIKDRCMDKQEELLAQFIASARARGTQVFLAEDGPAAIDYVLKLAEARGSKTCAKSKSLTTEEIQINHPMEDAGIEVIETDLGELIIQRVHEKPYHLVFPAVHKTAQEVAEIFRKDAGHELPPDPKVIMQVVRKYLRPIFLNADIGMTGANVGIAESGAIVIETNEGNARLVSSIPDLHICVMGIEKIVETNADALMMMMAHPVSATGQMLTTYVTLMAGRSGLGDGAGRKERESHIVILDNGRRKMRADPIMKDALNCIRCGACMNICPTYGVVGGHTFGYIYPGPIGIPWTSEVHGLEKAGNFADLCISCGLCKEICPAQIDIPGMIAEVKHRDQQHNPPPMVNRFLMMAESFAKMGSLTAPLANFSMKNSAFRWLLEKTVGIDRRRQLPEFRFNTFEKWFRNRKIPAHLADGKKVKRRVAFFMDIYANYNAPELGIAAVEALEARGAFVVLPPQQSSGYPYIGYGDLDAARRTASYNVEQMVRYVKEGFDVVATEPTATYCLAKAYPKLLHTADAKLVGEHSFEIFEYLLRLEADEHADPSAGPKPLAGRTYGFHCSCHQRPLTQGDAAMDWLRRRGATVTLYESGTCCGMAGTFGLKAGPLGYGLSQAVGEPLFKAFKDSGVDTIVTESSVCAIQLREGTGLKVIHPLELLK